MRFCREKGYAPVDLDVRVSMVLANGLWTSEWIEPMECNSDTCLTWIYSYVASTEHPKGLSIVCEGNPGGKYPVRINSECRVAAKPSGPLYPFVMPALLPEWGTGLHQLSVGVTVPADQLSQSTLDSGILSMRLEVFELEATGGRGRIVADDEIITNIEPLRAILSKSEVSQWRSRGAQGYLGCQLPAGEYTLVISTFGTQSNSGKVSIDFTVPADPLLSDLIIIRDLGGSGLDEGVRRGNESFYSISRPEFVPSTEITIRLEFRLPRDFDGQYNVWATLIPIPEIRSANRPEYSSNVEAVYWEDEDGNPKYNSKLPPEVLQPVRQDSRSVTLIDQTYRTQEEFITLRQKARLSVRPGKYVLSVQIANPRLQRTPLGMKAMVISILPD